MSEQTRYAVCDAALEELMLEAAEGMEAGLSQLTIILKMAQPRENEQWPAEVRKFWAENLEMVVERISPTNFRSCDGMFLESVLVAGFDSLLFRDRLVAYFKHVFHHYRDPAGMLETLGVRDRSLPLSTVLLRYQMLQQVKPGAYCYDRQAGLGTILQLDDIANELSIQFDRRLTIPLERFLSYFIIVKDLSFLHGLISNKSPRQVKMATLTEDILGSLLTMLPLEEELVQEYWCQKSSAKTNIGSSRRRVMPPQPPLPRWLSSLRLLSQKMN